MVRFNAKFVKSVTEMLPSSCALEKKATNMMVAPGRISSVNLKIYKIIVASKEGGKLRQSYRGNVFVV